MTRALAVVLLVVPLAGCAGRLSAPVQLTPVGDIAFYATRVLQGVEMIQTVAIEGEAAKVIATDDARRLVTATKVAGQAGVALANALKAGENASTARDKAVAAIRSALTDALAALPPPTADLVGPYVQVVLVLLTAFSS